MRMILTVAFCKIMIFFMRLFGFAATNLPGNFCLKVYPDIMRDMKMPKTVVFVTGTNGKTVSAITISHALRLDGLKVLNNDSGSNLNSGFISMFVKNASLSGVIRADAVVLECDEDAVAKMCNVLHPSHLLVTNIYRDSISRNAHPDFVLEKLRKTPDNVTFIINADDALAASIPPPNAKVIYFGAERAPSATEQCENIICDVRICPKCAMPVKFDYYQFHHIGRFHCEHCGYTQPKADFLARAIDEANHTFLLTDPSGAEQQFTYPTGSLFEVYNTAGIAALLSELNYPLSYTAKALSSRTDDGGRFEAVRANNTDIISMVGKSQNPISCSQSFAKAREIAGKKIIIIAINDRVYGGYDHNEDTSWLYDTDFEFLVSDEVLQYVVIGPRIYDVALRLVLAGADAKKIICTTEYNTDIVGSLDYDAVKGGTILYFFEVYFREWSKKMKKALAEEAKKHEAN